MGCGMSTEEKEGKARNEEIENQLKKDKLTSSAMRSRCFCWV